MRSIINYPSRWRMKILSETWFCSSEAPHWATSDQSTSTSFLGIRATPGTSDAEACVGVLAVLPSICQKSSMFLHITHWQSRLPSKNIMKCSLYPQISPPFPRRKWKNLSLHAQRVRVRYQETAKDFQIHPERKSTKKPGL